MSDIVMKSNKNECRNTGRRSKYLIKIVDGIKVWYKFCPSCGAEQTYNTLRAVSAATKNAKVCYSCINRGNNNPFFGKHHSEEHKKKLSNNQTNCSYRYKSVGNNPPKTTLKCKSCGASFQVTNCRLKSKYCSYSCATNDLFGLGDGVITAPEKKAMQILDAANEPYYYGYQMEGKIYDLYLPTHNLLIEIDGIYWHGKGLEFCEMDNIQKINHVNDLKKVALAIENGYSIVRIWETEVEKLLVPEHFC